MKTFKGGVHPSGKKELAKSSEISVFAVPELVSIPVAQHIGAPSKPCVEVGDHVKMGQVIAEGTGFVSVPQHSSVSGTVRKIEPRPHIFGNKVLNIIIENDGQDEKIETWGQETSLDDLDGKAIKDKIHDAGLVGMGGATFPTHVKLSPPDEFPIDSFILNGAECEPYLTCDYRIMQEWTEGILQGCEVLMKAVSCSRGYIGIESNKPDCAQKFREMNKSPNISIELLEVKYPQGAEKQLIYAILNRKVPAGGLPMMVNALVNNVGTAYASFEAVLKSIPLIQRVVSVTGEGVERPGNFLVRIGTPVSSLLEHCGLKSSANKIILGGPMMGLAQKTADLPVIKGTSGVLVLTDAKVRESGPCIHCGRCVEVCPMNLIPSEISIAVEAQREDLYERVCALDCIECGCCAYTCPSKRPIVHQVKLAKAVIQKQRAEAKAKVEAASKEESS
jgi:electron transport complex protein RnfC